MIFSFQYRQPKLSNFTSFDEVMYFLRASTGVSFLSSLYLAMLSSLFQVISWSKIAVSSEIEEYVWLLCYGLVFCKVKFWRDKPNLLGKKFSTIILLAIVFQNWVALSCLMTLSKFLCLRVILIFFYSQSSCKSFFFLININFTCGCASTDPY